MMSCLIGECQSILNLKLVKRFKAPIMAIKVLGKQRKMQEIEATFNLQTGKWRGGVKHVAIVERRRSVTRSNEVGWCNAIIGSFLETGLYKCVFHGRIEDAVRA